MPTWTCRAPGRTASPSCSKPWPTCTGSYAALGSGIHFAVGRPEEVLPALARQLHAGAVHASAEHTTEEVEAEEALRAALGPQVPLRCFETLTLLHPDDLPIPIGRLPLSFSKFRFDVAVKVRVRPPLPAPRQLPPLPPGFAPAPLPTADALTAALGLPAARGPCPTVARRCPRWAGAKPPAWPACTTTP